MCQSELSRLRPTWAPGGAAARTRRLSPEPDRQQAGPEWAHNEDKENERYRYRFPVDMTSTLHNKSCETQDLAYQGEKKPLPCGASRLCQSATSLDLKDC